MRSSWRLVLVLAVCLLGGLPEASARWRPRSRPAAFKPRRPVVTSRFVGRDGQLDIPAMMGFLGRIPTFRKDIAVYKAMERRGAIKVANMADVLPFVPPGAAAAYDENRLTGAKHILVNRAAVRSGNLKPGDVFYLLAHEVVHVADTQRMARLLARRQHRLPRELVSTSRADLRSSRIKELPNGLFVDRNLWLFLSEQRAYYTMNRLYNGLRRNSFCQVEFAGTDHLAVSGERKRSYKAFDCLDMTVAAPEVLRSGFQNAGRRTVVKELKRRGIDQQLIDRLNLPEKLSPVTTYTLACYLSADKVLDSSALDIRDPWLPRYAGLSVRQILSGALLER